MGNVLVGETNNFKIWYDPALQATNPEVVVNATTLMSTVEADFQVLTGWFGITGGFGQGNRINVNLTYKDNAGADNEGYQSNQTSQINLNGAPSVSPVPDVIRMLFVNELVEIFMSYNNQNAGGVWNAGDSNGEGLSHYCGYSISPTGHNAFYGTGLENAWMTTVRSGQYITGPPEGTDKDSVSYGCALLYLFYLHSQLGYSSHDIVQANGATLAQTYQKLTGRTDAFDPFLSLINDFFPRGTADATSDQLRVANPFPLLYGAGRSLNLSGTDQPSGNTVTLNIGEANVSPFFTCPKNLYQYTILGQPMQIVVTANTHGFGQASFSWTLNGVPLLPKAGDASASITLIGPDIAGGEKVENAGLNYTWQTVPSNRLSEQLILTLNDPFGRYDVAIECIATEMFAAAASESSMWIDGIDDRSTQWEPKFYEDQQKCAAPILQIISHYVHVHIPFFVALVAPDPPIDYKQAVQLLQNAGRALAVLDELSHRERRLMERLVEARLGVRASALRELAARIESREGEP